MNNPHPRLQTKKERLSLEKRRVANKAYRDRLKDQPEHYKQMRLWHRLHSLFTHKEFVCYENLPEKLQAQIQPFDEFIYPYTSTQAS